MPFSKPSFLGYPLLVVVAIVLVVVLVWTPWDH